MTSTGTRATPLPSFSDMRHLVAASPVAQGCVELRKAEARAGEWDIVPTRAAALAMRGDGAAMNSIGELREAAVRLFRHPDPNYAAFGSWLGTVVDEVVVTDSLAIWRGKMAGECAFLILDGATIEPACGEHGYTAGCRQYPHVVPRRSFMEVAASPTPAPVAVHTRSQVLYAPFMPRTWSPFGFSLVEQAMSPDYGGGKLTQDERLMMAFGIMPSALGIIGAHDSVVNGGLAWGGVMKYLGTVFTALLDDATLEWQWENPAWRQSWQKGKA